ncbi:oligogalacturonate-specific porin KdgM family protein [Vibrio algarum]|uniref:Oligogalacturonate-specific porin KdgM family protein n=1 Tax=Vibrio algarum TaxID=3020714 RepID=A0ABT4YWW0_9VIBR|nr:oligogalacturonate-specific porin KdgM family protein [Vibrio sp. KJ40-1]MDB1126064.1 oligogalacturonate-specific porin KdgM family protein [Vibrio sp. KJ40-1]
MLSMKKLSILTIASVATCSVSAATLDFRQEYKHDQEAYASRIKIGTSIDDHFFGLEAKQQGKPFSEWERADNEFEYGYHFFKQDGWRATASMPITFGNESITYKPQVRVQYKFDNGLTAKLRYRHEIRDFSNEENSRDRSKVTANLDYNWEAFQFGFEANYADDITDFAGDWPMSQSDKEWDYNVKIGYKEQDWSWRPYVEFGNVQCTSDLDCDSGRQLRSRVGITYSF